MVLQGFCEGLFLGREQLPGNQGRLQEVINPWSFITEILLDYQLALEELIWRFCYLKMVPR